jgi:hypothetical protein
MIASIAANLPLIETQKQCKLQQADTYQLKGITVGTKPNPADPGQPFLVNKCQFEIVQAGLPKDLFFVEGIVATKPDWTKLFDCKMYVESHVKDVTVFGK